jgi:hypothetical protein
LIFRKPRKQNKRRMEAEIHVLRSTTGRKKSSFFAALTSLVQPIRENCHYCIEHRTGELPIVSATETARTNVAHVAAQLPKR